MECFWGDFLLLHIGGSDFVYEGDKGRTVFIYDGNPNLTQIIVASGTSKKIRVVPTNRVSYSAANTSKFRVPRSVPFTIRVTEWMPQ